MKVSVITVVYNCASTVETCLASVAAQTHADKEHIVVDGASTDGTREIIERHASSLSPPQMRWVSEKDSGMYEAMNKGLAMASGELIAFLNADDFYTSRDALAAAVETISRESTDSVFSDLVYVDRNDLRRVVRYWKARPFVPGMFWRGEFPPHPTFMVRRQIYERFGGFNQTLRLGSDFELMLRFLEKQRISSFYIPRVLVSMRYGGASNRSLRAMMRSLRECYRGFALNGLRVTPLFFIRTLVFRVRHLWHKPTEKLAALEPAESGES